MSEIIGPILALLSVFPPIMKTRYFQIFAQHAWTLIMDACACADVFFFIKSKVLKFRQTTIVIRRCYHSMVWSAQVVTLPKSHLAEISSHKIDENYVCLCFLIHFYLLSKSIILHVVLDHLFNLRGFSKCRCFHREFLIALFWFCVILGVTETQLMISCGMYTVCHHSKVGYVVMKHLDNICLYVFGIDKKTIKHAE